MTGVCLDIFKNDGSVSTDERHRYFRIPVVEVVFVVIIILLLIILVITIIILILFEWLKDFKDQNTINLRNASGWVF